MKNKLANNIGAIFILGIFLFLNDSKAQTSTIKSFESIHFNDLILKNLETTKDSMHYGFWKFNFQVKEGYYQIYSKNDSLFLNKFKINESYRDKVNGTDFFQFERKNWLMENKDNSISVYAYIIDEYSISNPSVFYFIDLEGNLYHSIPEFNYIKDTTPDYIYYPIINPMDMFTERKEAPLKEANFQKLCAQNDTNTIGYFFGNLGMTRIYKENDKQWVLMSPDDASYDVFRLSVEPNKEGYLLKHLYGYFHMDGTYYILSKDSLTLSVYDKKHGLQAIWSNKKDEYVYDGWDIGIACKEEFYSLPKNDE